MSPAPTNAAPDQAAGPERRATVRIDAQPGGKKFQGVWLEIDDGARWVIDYRPRPVWAPFADAVVLVTGHCYQPFGQAISATHFEVERLRVATPDRGVRPLLEVGPERLLRGAFAAETHGAGTKLAGSTDVHFRADDGASFRIWGGVDDELTGERVTVLGRQVELDPTYAATPGGDHLWVARVEAADYAPDPQHADEPKPCP